MGDNDSTGATKTVSFLEYSKETMLVVDCFVEGWDEESVPLMGGNIVDALLALGSAGYLKAGHELRKNSVYVELEPRVVPLILGARMYKSEGY